MRRFLSLLATDPTALQVLGLAAVITLYTPLIHRLWRLVHGR